MKQIASFLTVALLLFVAIQAKAQGKGKGKDIGSEWSKEPEKDTGKGTECSNSAYEGYRTIEQGSDVREYILYIPPSYTPDQPIPLVINFHGFGDCASNYAATIGNLYGFNSTAEDNHFLVAYPQGAFREKGARYWEPGDTGRQDIAENDVYFTAQLIADIDNDYNLDLSRVYAVGFSNGGMMAYDLACSASNSIAAVGVMSGIMLADGCGGEGVSTSAIHFHGIADGVLPYEGDQNYRSVSEVVDSWLGQNRISTGSRVSRELNNGDVVRDVYTGGNENTSVVLYTVHREHGKAGGHVWFSDEIDGLHPNQILWDFLSAYSLDSVPGIEALPDGGIRLRFWGVHGRRYQAQYTDVLVDGQTVWADMGDPVAAKTDSGIVEVLDETLRQRARFYRLNEIDEE